MHRFLVVANQTLGGDHLLEAVRVRREAGPCSFHLLVPAAEHEHAFHTEGEAHALAQQRLSNALLRLEAEGADVDGEVGVANAQWAVLDLLRREPFDEIILSTLPAGPSRWIRQDLPHRLRRVTRVPVVHIVAPAEIGVGGQR